jgi:hypothetical protein
MAKICHKEITTQHYKNSTHLIEIVETTKLQEAYNLFLEGGHFLSTINRQRYEWVSLLLFIKPKTFSQLSTMHIRLAWFFLIFNF